MGHPSREMGFAALEAFVAIEGGYCLQGSGASLLAHPGRRFSMLLALRNHGRSRRRR